MLHICKIQRKDILFHVIFVSMFVIQICTMCNVYFTYVGTTCFIDRDKVSLTWL